jgi:hypothetical protein
VPLQQDLREPFRAEKNYKEILTRLLRQSRLLESGGLFRSYCISPIELSALASYKNVVATGNDTNNAHPKRDEDPHFDNLYKHDHIASGQILY